MISISMTSATNRLSLHDGNSTGRLEMRKIESDNYTATQFALLRKEKSHVHHVRALGAVKYS